MNITSIPQLAVGGDPSPIRLSSRAQFKSIRIAFIDLLICMKKSITEKIGQDGTSSKKNFAGRINGEPQELSSYAKSRVESTQRRDVHNRSMRA